MDRYEISLMTFMALWWLVNVVSVWMRPNNGTSGYCWAERFYM